jgi:hypothetical protein
MRGNYTQSFVERWLTLAMAQHLPLAGAQGQPSIYESVGTNECRAVNEFRCSARESPALEYPKVLMDEAAVTCSACDALLTTLGELRKRSKPPQVMTSGRFGLLAVEAGTPHAGDLVHDAPSRSVVSLVARLSSPRWKSKADCTIERESKANEKPESPARQRIVRSPRCPARHFRRG